MSLIRFAPAILIFMLVPGAALAQSAPAAPPPPAKAALTLTVQTSAAADLGQPNTVRALVVGPDGAPVSGVPVDFSRPANFLNTPGSISFGRAITDDQGVASIEWEPRSNGSVTLNATFAGDQHFAATKATTTVQVGGDQQLYQQQAGVALPGVNAAPAFTRTAALAPIASPWPRLSGWPLVVVLLIVWSLYFRAVTGLFTIARGRDPNPAGRQGA